MEAVRCCDTFHATRAWCRHSSTRSSKSAWFRVLRSKLSPTARLLPEEPVNHPEARAVRSQPALVLQHLTRSGVVARRSGKGRPKLILIVGAKRNPAVESEIAGRSRRVCKITALQAAGGRVKRSRDPSAAHAQLAPEGQALPPVEAITRTDQIIRFDHPSIAMPVEPARLTFDPIFLMKVEVEDR